MPRSLVSSWKRIAMSGPTIDGREISPQELREAAETYDPQLYTATIWCEHKREHGAYGTVYAVRLVDKAPEFESGQVALEAQLKPNNKLLRLNDAGEKLFSSVELLPNFRNSGKFYLSGMAVTDEPASLGTQELYFSKRDKGTGYRTAPVRMTSRPMTKRFAASLAHIKRELAQRRLSMKEKKEHQTKPRRPLR